MGTWKYRYHSIGAKIHEGFIEIKDDDDRLEVIERIQLLRIRLHNKGYKFIDAAPINGAEKSIRSRLSNLKRFKKPVRLKPKRRTSFLLIVSLLLLVLLLLLAIL